MTAYIVTSELIVYCKVEIELEAANKEAALDAATDILPNKVPPYGHGDNGWKAAVTLFPPKGVSVRKCKPIMFEQTSGPSDKVRKAKDQPKNKPADMRKAARKAERRAA